MKISLQLDRRTYSPGDLTRYAWLRIEVPRKPQAAPRPPLDIALVLDRSGSMGGEKIALAKEAAKRAVTLLRDTDRCAFVAYDDEVIRPVPAGFVTDAHRRLLYSALDELEARASTNLFGGWTVGAEEISAAAESRIRRVLLLSDGLANQGLVDHAQILAHVRELAQRGVGTSTFGVGRDFDELLMAGMSEAGSGHFYFIEHARQIPDFLTSELGEILATVARSARVRIAAPQPIHIDCINGLPTLDEAFDLGDLAEGSTIDLCFALGIPESFERLLPLHATLAWVDLDGKEQTMAEEAAVAASDGTSPLPPLNEAVIGQVVKVRASRARDEALTFNREGQFKKALAVIEAETAQLKWLGDLPTVKSEVASLEGLLNSLAEPMDALTAKKMKFASYAARRSRPDPSALGHERVTDGGHRQPDPRLYVPR